MGWNDHFGGSDGCSSEVRCRCGAVYSIYEDDGVPGCRDVETVNCQFCGAELARHFGNCNGRLVDDKQVSDELKCARDEHSAAFRAYVQKNGYAFGTDEYAKILMRRRDTLKKLGYE